MAAAGVGLDQPSRLPGTAGRNLSGAVEAKEVVAMAMTARDIVLATVRRSLGVSGAEAPRRMEVATRLAGHPPGVVPERGQLPPAPRVSLFVRMVEAAAG